MKRSRLRSRLADVILSTACMSLLAAVFTACQHDKGSFSIDTPGNFANLTELTGISGTWEDGEYEGTLTGVRLTLMRYSDNKFWNGSSWGSSFDLPTTVGAGTWQVAAGTSLPSGADLPPDYYLIEAYADFSYEPSTHNAMFTVGVPAPPMLPSPWAWGNNGEGRMGVGALEGGFSPLPVFMRGALEGKIVTGIAAGGKHTLAITGEGRLYSWGDDTSGQLGSTALPDSGGANLPFNFAPVRVDDTDVLSGKTITFMAAGQSHSLAASDDGLVFAWGSNLFGQVGQGTTVDEYDLPVAVTGLLTGKHVIAVSGGLDQSIALTDTGTLYAWGGNSLGQVGDGTNDVRRAPVAVSGLGGAFITAVDCGDSHSLALTSDGTLYAWGRGADGQLGTGGTADSNVPVLISGPWGIRKIVSMSAGGDHSLAVDEDGAVYAWGRNDNGQLGTGDVTERLSPVQVTAGVLVGEDIHLVQAGADFSIAQTHDNKVFTWGGNSSGQLARSTAPDSFSHTPQQADLSAALSGGRVLLGLSAGAAHVEVLTGFSPNPEPEIEVEAQGVALVDESGPGIHFGAQAYGVSTPVWITVRNVGQSDLTDLEAWVDGPDGIDYWTIFYPPALGPNAPNNVTGFYVFFQPFGNGNPAPTTHSGVLHIKSNDADENTFDIALTGTGYPGGKPETLFTAGANALLSTTVVQPDGKILLGGSFTTLQPKGSASPVNRKNIGRLNPDGTLDTSFWPDADDWVRCVALQHDGKILIGGQFSSLQPGGSGTVHARNCLARLNPDGTVDTDFVANLNGLVRCIVPLSTGQILIGGQFTTVNNGSGPVTRNRIALLNADGSLDTFFNPGANGEVLTMALDNWHRVYVAGSFSSIGGEPRDNVALLDLTDGSVDDWVAVQGGLINALAMDVDGAVLIGGEFTKSLPGGGTVSNLIRVMHGGLIDEYWRPNPGYRVNGINVQADGRFIVSGSFTTVQPYPDESTTARNRMARFHVNGSLDASFDPNFNGEVHGAAIQADGQVLPAGIFTTVGTPPEACVGTARLTSSAVTDVLTVPSLDYIHWERGGAAAETTDVRFDLSTDGGNTWTPLSGTTSRSNSGWQHWGASLPSTGRIRARARCASGDHNGSSGIVEKVVVFGEPPNLVVQKNGLPIAFGDSHEFGVIGTGSSSGSAIYTIHNNGGGPLTGLSGVAIEGSTHFRIAGPSSGTVASGGLPATLTVLFQPKTTGTHSAILHIPSNDPDQPIFDILLSGTGSLPITTWRAQNYNGETTNTGDASDSAIPAGDGLTNLEKYALGKDPHTATDDGTSMSLSAGVGAFAPAPRGDAAEAPLSGATFFFNYQRNKLALADIIFQVEWSDTLAENDWHSDGVTEEVTSDDGMTQQVQATVPTGSAGRRFVRLRMTRL